MNLPKPNKTLLMNSTLRKAPFIEATFSTNNYGVLQPTGKFTAETNYFRLCFVKLSNTISDLVVSVSVSTVKG